VVSHTPVITTLGRWRQEDHEFEASLNYTATSVSKTKRTNKQNKERKLQEN
jgi:hypothetical protein